MANYSWKGLQDGKYTDGTVEAINRDEAAFKVKEQKVIITSLTKISGGEVTKKERGGGVSLFSSRRKKVPITDNTFYSQFL